VINISKKRVMKPQEAYVKALGTKLFFARTKARTLYHVSEWIWHPSVDPLTGLMHCNARKPVLGELWNPDLDDPVNIDAAVAWK
jgi:hypothetical protein